MSVGQWDFEIDPVEAARLEEERLKKRYYKAVGWCLQYKIPVYAPGVPGAMKSLGQLEQAIADHEGRLSVWDWHRMIARAAEGGDR